MGIHEWICTKCNFKILLHSEWFYIECNEDKLSDITYLSKEMQDNSSIYGQIMRNYCPNCNKLIKTYIITKSKYSEEKSINMLEKILKKSDITETDFIDAIIDFQKDLNEDCRSFGEEILEEEIDQEYYERFKKNENILTVVQFENCQITDFKDASEYIEYMMKNRWKVKICCPQCNQYLSREFQGKQCSICGNEVKSGFWVDI